MFLCICIIAPSVQRLHLLHMRGPTAGKVAFRNDSLLELPLGLLPVTILFKVT